jgi:hypothetical protein
MSSFLLATISHAPFCPHCLMAACQLRPHLSRCLVEDIHLDRMADEEGRMDSVGVVITVTAAGEEEGEGSMIGD